MKTDARVRYTVHMIQNVFLELLKEKPVAKITVKEICGHAEINRSTFYKHYQDVYDLMEKLENEAVEAFEKLLDDLFQETAWDVSTDISVLHTMLAQEGLTEDGLKK